MIPDPKLSVDFASPALPASGSLVLLVTEGDALSGLAQRADEATGGAVTRAFEAASYKGGKGKVLSILAPGAGLSRIVAVGLGKAADTTPRILEEAGGSAVPTLARDTAAAIAADGLGAAQAAHVALGAALRSYRFDRYRTKEKPEDKPKLEKLILLTADPAAASRAWAPQLAVAKGVFLARDLVSEPGNILTPSEFARRCDALAELGVEIETIGPARMRELKFGALLGVAQGSAEEPRMVTMRWRGGGPGGKPLAFIGKGVTFDTGGISIKPAAGMEDMKWDMAGAGAVTGLMAALAGRKARVDAIGIVGLVENMPSATAQRPGDVVTTASGQTVEVINTDAEGRLVLADVMWHCQQTYDPAFMIDLATLTGAMIISLGHDFAGMFASDDALAERLAAAGQAVGDKVWRLPLDDAYDQMLKSEIADMKNVGGRPGGAISAAHFIKRFCNGKPWAHLDIAGTAWATKDSPCTPKGATAFGVRLLDRLVADHYEAS